MLPLAQAHWGLWQFNTGTACPHVGVGIFVTYRGQAVEKCMGVIVREQVSTWTVLAGTVQYVCYTIDEDVEYEECYCPIINLKNSQLFFFVFMQRTLQWVTLTCYSGINIDCQFCLILQNIGIFRVHVVREQPL